jgi:Protein of unknown function (DUF3187)
LEEKRRKPLRQIITVIITILITVWGAVAHADVGREVPAVTPYGPLRLVNQQPLQLLFLQLSPDVTTPVQAGHALVHFDVALTNTLLQQEGPVTADIDLEMVRAVVDLRYGLLQRLEVGVELPFLYTYGGILDEFIEDFERLLGVLCCERAQQNAREVSYRVFRGNRQILQGDANAAGIGDMAVKLKFRLWPEGTWQPALSLRTAVKFPTGAKAQAFGSGEVDGGIGLLLQKTFGRWTVYINSDITFPGDGFASVAVQPFVSGLVALEYRLSQPLSLVAQFRGDSRPFYATIPVLDHHLYTVLLGFNWAIAPALVLQGGITEDVFDSSCCSADLSVFVNLTTRL